MVSRNLGHSSIAVTADTYGHLADGASNPSIEVRVTSERRPIRTRWRSPRQHMHQIVVRSTHDRCAASSCETRMVNVVLGSMYPDAATCALVITK